MKKLLFFFLSFLFLATLSYAQFSPGRPFSDKLEVQEDGGGSYYPDKLIFTTVTDNGDGSVTIANGAGGGGGSNPVLKLNGVTNVTSAAIINFIGPEFTLDESPTNTGVLGFGANVFTAGRMAFIGTATGTAGNIFVADGTDFESVAMSGDCTITSSGLMTCTGGASALGDLSDVGTATATSGNLLIADGSAFQGIALSGDVTVGADGVATIQANAIGSSEITDGSIDETDLDTSVNASLDLADSALQSSAIGSSIQAYDADLDDLADGSLTGTKVGFADTNSDFTATDVQSAIEELVANNGSGPNAADGKVSWTQLVDVPAGFSDGTDDGSGGGSGDDVWVNNTNVTTAKFTDNDFFQFARDTNTNTVQIYGVANSITAGMLTDTYLTAEVDGSTTNELQNLFNTVTVAGETPVVASGLTDTLELVSGLNMTITIVNGAVVFSSTDTDTDTQLSEEEVEDFVGGMLGGTETLISVDYDDLNNSITFVVDNDLANYDNSTSGFLTSNAVTSVNSQVGVVVLDADDIDDTSTTNKFTTAGDISKLAGIESLADVTDTANVTAAGALMDSEVTDLAGIKALNTSTLQIKPSEGAFVDGDKTKLDGIEALADVTDTTNVTAAGALMDSEVDADLKTLSLPASTTITSAAATILDDTTVSAMVDTLGGASSTGTGGLVRATSPSLVTPSLGVATATSINGATITSGTLNGSVTGTNTGDQTITLTGSVTGSGTGSFPTAIATNAVTASNIDFIGTPTATLGNILVSDGTDFEGVAMGGDGTINASGAIKLNPTQLAVGSNNAVTIDVNNLGTFPFAQVIETDNALEGGLAIVNSDETIGLPGFVLAGRARGTPTSKTAVQTDDELANYAAGGYDGDEFVIGGQIKFVADDDASDDYLPTKMQIVLRDSNGDFNSLSIGSDKSITLQDSGIPYIYGTQTPEAISSIGISPNNATSVGQARIELTVANHVTHINGIHVFVYNGATDGAIDVGDSIDRIVDASEREVRVNGFVNSDFVDEIVNDDNGVNVYYGTNGIEYVTRNGNSKSIGYSIGLFNSPRYSGFNGSHIAVGEHTAFYDRPYLNSQGTGTAIIEKFNSFRSTPQTTAGEVINDLKALRFDMDQLSSSSNVNTAYGVWIGEDSNNAVTALYSVFSLDSDAEMRHAGNFIVGTTGTNAVTTLDVRGGFALDGTTCLDTSGDRIFHDTDCDGTKDAGEEFVDAAGSGDSITIDGTAQTDPDFRSDGDITLIDNTNTVVFNLTDQNVFLSGFGGWVVEQTTNVVSQIDIYDIDVNRKWAGMNIVTAFAKVDTPGATGVTTINLYNETSGQYMFSTPITIDCGEADNTTAATGFVIDTAQDDLTLGDDIRTDVLGTCSTANTGLYVDFGFCPDGKTCL